MNVVQQCLDQDKLVAACAIQAAARIMVEIREEMCKLARDVKSLREGNE